MSDPVVRSIVSHHGLPFPVAGTIWNFNPALGQDGIIGVKSGYTSEALGCLATAAYRSANGHSTRVVAGSLGHPDGLYEASTTDGRGADLGQRQPARSSGIPDPLRHRSDARRRFDR